jgi:hypothetical protein
MNVVAESTRIAVGVPCGSPPEEARVALVPSVVPQLVKSGLDVIVERGAGESAGFPDADYEQHGAHLGTRRDALGPTSSFECAVGVSTVTGTSTCHIPIKCHRAADLATITVRRRPGTSSSRPRSRAASPG